MGPAPLGGSWKRGKVAARWESLHRQGNQPGQKGTFRSSEKRATTGLWWQGGWGPHIRSCHHPVPPSLRLVWLGAGTQGLEDRPRDRTAAGCPETAWRGRSVLRSQLGCSRRKPTPPWKQGPIVKWRRGSRATIAASFSAGFHTNHCLGQLQGLRSGGLCEHMQAWTHHTGPELGPGLSPLHSSHSGCRHVTHCTGGLMKTTSEGHQGWLLPSSGLKQGRAWCQQQCEPTKHVTSNTTEHTHRWIAPAEHHSMAPLPVGLIQSTYFPPQLRSIAQKSIWGLLLQQPGSRLASDRAVTPTEQRGGPTQHSGQSLVPTPVTPPIKGITANVYWGKRWQTSTLKTAFIPKILKPHNLHRDTPT